MQYDLGQRMGLTGTPMIMAADGTRSPATCRRTKLRAALDKLAGEAAPAVEDRRASAPEPRRSAACSGRREAGHAPASLQ